jgi:hypothetical protein
MTATNIEECFKFHGIKCDPAKVEWAIACGGAAGFGRVIESQLNYRWHCLEFSGITSMVQPARLPLVRELAAGFGVSLMCSRRADGWVNIQWGAVITGSRQTAAEIAI